MLESKFNALVSTIEAAAELLEKFATEERKDAKDERKSKSMRQWFEGREASNRLAADTLRQRLKGFK